MIERKWRLFILLLLLALPSRVAFSETEVPSVVLTPDQKELQKAQKETEENAGPLQLTLSILPGVLVHGSGQLIAGDSKLGLRLLAAQGIGIVGLAGGVAMLAITGASDKFNVPVIWSMSLGGAAFLFSWFGDIYASSGARHLTGRPRSLPLLEVGQGAQYVFNPVVDGGFYSKTSVKLASKKWLGSGSIFVRPDFDDIRSELRGQYRILGRGRDSERFFVLGDHLDLKLGYDFHTYDEGRVSEHHLPVSLSGRLDLRHLGESLRGAFADASIGLVFGSYFYESGDSEYAEQLIADIGFGVYLGQGDGTWGSAKLSYRHRHDGYIGGSKVPGLGSGTLGSANFRLRRSLFADWGFELGAAAGSAYVFDLSAIFRWNTGTQRGGKK